MHFCAKKLSNNMAVNSLELVRPLNTHFPSESFQRKNRATFFFPEISFFQWNELKSRVPFTNEPEFPEIFVNGNRLCVMHSHLNDMEIPGTKRFIPKGFELDARLSSSIWSIRSFITETLTALHMIIIRLLPFVLLKPLVFLFRRQCKTSEQRPWLEAHTSFFFFLAYPEAWCDEKFYVYI